MQALDVATEGLLGNRGYEALLNPDFWLQSLIRSRAEGMTWTPGLVMDYASALNRVLEPQARECSTVLNFIFAREPPVRNKAQR